MCVQTVGGRKSTINHLQWTKELFSLCVSPLIQKIFALELLAQKYLLKLQKRRITSDYLSLALFSFLLISKYESASKNRQTFVSTNLDLKGFQYLYLCRFKKTMNSFNNATADDFFFQLWQICEECQDDQVFCFY